ncbi:MAG TPA: GGDEF domain-containing protein [Geobacteraceae bacterium]|nr:GGDEF domain-containing protein [Geobacteraceae bacterium]
MIGALFKRLNIFAVPAVLLVAAYLGMPRIPILPTPWRELLPYLPFATIAVGMFLSLHFHRSRAFFVLLMLAVFSWSCGAFLRDGLTDFRSRMVFQALSLLLPLNITLFCFMRERGVFSHGGRLRIAFLAGQGGLIAWFVRYNYTGVEQLMARKFLATPFLNRLPISQAALFVLCAGSLLMAIRVIKRQSHIDSGLLGAMAAVVLVCIWQAMPDASLAFIAAAAVTLTLSILQDTYNMAFRDDLTGLQSRRALNEQLMGLGRQYVVAMVDVDHFKRFNDTYGHDVGDQVLKMVATKIQGVMGGGKAFRYGGEEFTIIFPRKKEADTIPHLDELRKSIAGYQLWLRSPERPKKSKEGEKQRTDKGGETAVSVTVSIGVAGSEDGHTPFDVIRDADKALYRAKHKGRNQVCR